MHGDWHALGEVQYRKWAVYEPMAWSADTHIDEYVVSGASYGGPIAMVRDHRRLMPLAEAEMQTESPILNIYSSAGTTLAEVISAPSVVCRFPCFPCPIITTIS